MLTQPWFSPAPVKSCEAVASDVRSHRSLNCYHTALTPFATRYIPFKPILVSTVNMLMGQIVVLLLIFVSQLQLLIFFSTVCASKCRPWLSHSCLLSMCVQCADVAVFLCFLFLLYHYFTFAYPLHFNAKQALLHHRALYPSLPFSSFLLGGSRNSAGLEENLWSLSPFPCFILAEVAGPCLFASYCFPICLYYRGPVPGNFA